MLGNDMADILAGTADVQGALLLGLPYIAQESSKTSQTFNFN